MSNWINTVFKAFNLDNYFVTIFNPPAFSFIALSFYPVLSSSYLDVLARRFLLATLSSKKVDLTFIKTLKIDVASGKLSISKLFDCLMTLVIIALSSFPEWRF